MTHEQLIVAQAEAFTILRDLMHMTADDPRPQRIINTIKQAALAILRLKPLAPRAQGERTIPASGSGEGQSARRTHPLRSPGSTPNSEPETRAPDPTAHLTDDQFVELLQHMPDSLDPTTDKRRLRLARYLARFHLGVTPEIKDAIRARAARLAESIERQRAA